VATRIEAIQIQFYEAYIVMAFLLVDLYGLVFKKQWTNAR
jgi:hypothetical protein